MPSSTRTPPLGILPRSCSSGHKELQWIQSPQAGPKAGYYHEGLVQSDVVVTNMRGIFSDHISAHIMSYVLSFARGLHVYRDRQRDGEWKKGYDAVHLPEATAVIVGVGGIGAETARLCAEFGMTVVGVDGRVTESPPGVTELYRPDATGGSDTSCGLPHRHGAGDAEHAGSVQSLDTPRA